MTSLNQKLTFASEASSTQKTRKKRRTTKSSPFYYNFLFFSGCLIYNITFNLIRSIIYIQGIYDVQVRDMRDTRRIS